MAFTDHRTYGYHPELTDENFIALAGIEVDVSENPEKCGRLASCQMLII